MLADPILKKPANALPRLTLSTAAGASMDVYHHGAHLTSWKTAQGKEWMFLSKQAVFTEDSAIRGGVPVIFPQFSGFGSGPRHGFARTMQWQLSHTESTPDLATCTFTLTASDATLAVWPHRFLAEFTATLQNDQLHMTLTAHNTDQKPFTFSAALHTYFLISDIHRVQLTGTKGLHYWDNNGSDFSQDRFIDQQNTLQFPDAIDRVYFSCQTPLQLVDGNDRLEIQAKGFEDVVVWNPGAEATKQLADMADDDYRKMLCVEAALIDKPMTLAPGETWSGSQILRQE